MNINKGVDFFENGLCFFCHDVKNDLHRFNHFHSEAESSWEIKDKDTQEKLNKILEKYPKRTKQPIF